jgi:predicted hydrocarbon binding protein
MTDQICLPRANLYYPNIVARQTLCAAEEILGKTGLNIVLHQAGLERFTDNFPPANLKREFDFADFSALCAAFDLSGERLGTPDLGFQVGRRTYKYGLEQFSAFAGMGGILLGLRNPDMQTRIKVGLHAMATIFNAFSDQRTTIGEHEAHTDYVIHNTPICWGREHTCDHAVCGIAAGLIYEGLIWSTDHEWQVVETTCRAKGDPVCTFTVYHA